jgi:hypothetical protein
LYGADHYIPAERVFAYEHGSPHKLTDKRRDKLMDEVDREEFQKEPIARRIVFNDLERFVREHEIDIGRPEDVENLKEQFASECLDAEIAIASLVRFCRVEPNLPDAAGKPFIRPGEPLGLNPDLTREEVIGRLERLRGSNAMAEMAFYAYRDLNRTEAEPFLLAAMQRNPVSIEGTCGLSAEAVETRLRALPNESIYDEPGRLAQPDEVWNFGRGDGVERALILANILRSRRPSESMRIEVGPDRARLIAGSLESAWSSRKQLAEQVWNLP